MVKNTPKGRLVNPHKDTQEAIVAQGSKDFQHYSCGGCHGGDDDTMFRLVTPGSEQLQKQGYTRTGREHGVGPMMPLDTIIQNAGDLWKILAFMRCKYSGDPGHKFATPAAQ